MPDDQREDGGGSDEVHPRALLTNHLKTGEPLSEDELSVVVSAGLAARPEFSMRGGGLWWHDATFPDPDTD